MNDLGDPAIVTLTPRGFDLGRRLVEKLGRRVRLVPGHPRNIKVTTKEDLDLLRYYLKRDSNGR